MECCIYIYYTDYCMSITHIWVRIPDCLLVNKAPIIIIIFFFHFIQ